MGIFDFNKNKENSDSPEAKETPKTAEVKQKSQSAEAKPAEAAAAPAPKAEEKKPAMSCVYGPVGSWRLGRSLGIDMLCTEQKTCNFDCVYCQLPGSGSVVTERQEFVSLSKLFDDINAVKGRVQADWVTFSGMGEPTLATNLGEAISMAKSVLGLPVAVMTNGSLIRMKEVRKALSLADMVVIKLDAFDDDSFNAINKPSGVHSIGKMVQQWQMFRLEYKGKMAISVMLSDLNKGGMYDLQLKARLVMPDQVQLNTPLRPSTLKPLAKADFDKCKQWFWDFKEVVNVYNAAAPSVEPLNAAETEKRHRTARKEQKPA